MPKKSENKLRLSWSLNFVNETLNTISTSEYRRTNQPERMEQSAYLQSDGKQSNRTRHDYQHLKYLSYAAPWNVGNCNKNMGVGV